MIQSEVNVERMEVSAGEDKVAVLAFLRVNGRPVPIELFETVPEEPLAGEPIGWVNLHGEACATAEDHLHVLWLNENGDLRTSRVPREQRWARLPQIFVSSPRAPSARTEC
jgi:hypothetical protein